MYSAASNKFVQEQIVPLFTADGKTLVIQKGGMSDVNSAMPIWPFVPEGTVGIFEDNLLAYSVLMAPRRPDRQLDNESTRQQLERIQERIQGDSVPLCFGYLQDLRELRVYEAEPKT